MTVFSQKRNILSKEIFQEWSREGEGEKDGEKERLTEDGDEREACDIPREEEKCEMKILEIIIFPGNILK